MTKPRQKTLEEMREELMHHVRNMIRYWAAQGQNKESSLEGLAHSIFTALDGNTMGCPGYLLIPNCTKEDKKFYIEEGNNFYPIPSKAMLAADVGGALRYEVFLNKKKVG